MRRSRLQVYGTEYKSCSGINYGHRRHLTTNPNRSNVRSDDDKAFTNLRPNPVTSPEVIKLIREDKFKAGNSASEHSSKCSSSPSSSSRSITVVDPNVLVGRTLLLDK